MSVLPRLLIGSLLAVVLAACSDDPEPTTAADPQSQEPETETNDTVAPFLVAQDGELVVSCWSEIGWPTSLMPDGLPGELTAEETKAAFAEMLELTDNSMDLRTFLPDGADTESRLLWHEGDEYAFGVGPGRRPDPGRAATSSSPRTAAPAGGGPGRGLSARTGPPAGKPLARAARRRTRPNHDRARHRDQRARLHVLGTRTRTSTSRSSLRPPSRSPSTGPPLRRRAARPVRATPTVSRPLPLDEPLGDRQLLDGSTYPPSPVR